MTIELSILAVLGVIAAAVLRCAYLENKRLEATLRMMDRIAEARRAAEAPTRECDENENNNKGE